MVQFCLGATLFGEAPGKPMPFQRGLKKCTPMFSHCIGGGVPGFSRCKPRLASFWAGLLAIKTPPPPQQLHTNPLDLGTRNTSGENSPITQASLSKAKDSLCIWWLCRALTGLETKARRSLKRSFCVVFLDMFGFVSIGSFDFRLTQPEDYGKYFRGI